MASNPHGNLLHNQHKSFNGANDKRISHKICGNASNVSDIINTKTFRTNFKRSDFPVLVLNADYMPLSYFPLSLWSWQDAIKAVYLDRVEVLSCYDEFVHSPNFDMQLPSVISLKEYVKQDRSLAFTRFNLFLRDGFSCVYCGSKQDLTFDHVIPRRLGGKTAWDNIVTACSHCNPKKGGRTPQQAKMPIPYKPYRPSIFELQEIGRRFPPNHLHQTWIDWLYWDIELEE